MFGFVSYSVPWLELANLASDRQSLQNLQPKHQMAAGMKPNLPMSRWRSGWNGLDGVLGCTTGSGIRCATSLCSHNFIVSFWFEGLLLGQPRHNSKETEPHSAHTHTHKRTTVSIRFEALMWLGFAARRFC